MDKHNAIFFPQILILQYGGFQEVWPSITNKACVSIVPFPIKTKVCYVFTFFQRPSYYCYCLKFQKMNIGHVNQQVYYSIAGYWLIYGHFFVTVVQSYVIIILGKIGVVASTKSFSLLEYLLGNTKFYSNQNKTPS